MSRMGTLRLEFNVGSFIFDVKPNTLQPKDNDKPQLILKSEVPKQWPAGKPCTNKNIKLRKKYEKLCKIEDTHENKRTLIAKNIDAKHWTTVVSGPQIHFKWCSGPSNKSALNLTFDLFSSLMSVFGSFFSLL